MGMLFAVPAPVVVDVGVVYADDSGEELAVYAVEFRPFVGHLPVLSHGSEHGCEVLRICGAGAEYRLYAVEAADGLLYVVPVILSDGCVPDSDLRSPWERERSL